MAPHSLSLREKWHQSNTHTHTQIHTHTHTHAYKTLMLTSGYTPGIIFFFLSVQQCRERERKRGRERAKGIWRRERAYRVTDLSCFWRGGEWPRKACGIEVERIRCRFENLFFFRFFLIFDYRTDRSPFEEITTEMRHFESFEAHVFGKYSFLLGCSLSFFGRVLLFFGSICLLLRGNSSVSA